MENSISYFLARIIEEESDSMLRAIGIDAALSAQIDLMELDFTIRRGIEQRKELLLKIAAMTKEQSMT